MKMTKIQILLFLILLAGILCQCNDDAEPQEFPDIYLPQIYLNYSPIIDKGVGLSGPYSAVDLLGVQWYYTWGIHDEFGADSRYVPMLYSSLQDLDEALEIARNGSGWILFLNEPDQEGQANKTPLEAAWMQLKLEQNAMDIRLVSPAPSQDNPNWLWQMVAAYQREFGRKPRFDAIAVHYYCVDGKWTSARDYLIGIRQQAVAYGYSNSQIWLTEFGGECWTAQNHNKEIMENLIPWMENQEWIGRYAWFASMLPDPPQTPDLKYCSLTDPETEELTDLGGWYREEIWNQN